MFNLFKNSHDKGKSLAKHAKIIVGVDKGLITSFVIFVKGNDTSITKKLQNSDYSTSFVYAIEDRIKKNEYEDPRRGLFPGLMPETPNVDDIAKAIRIVVSANSQPVFKWEP